MQWKQAIRAACLASAALSAAAIGDAAPASGQSEAAIDYDLPAQDLGETLRAIARLSGHEVLFAADAVRGLRAPAIRGHLSLDGALKSALSGSPLRVEYRGGAALVRPEGGRLDATPAASEGPAITVTGTRIRGAGSASPVLVTTRRDLERAGISNLADFTRILPQNYTGGQNPGIAGDGEQGGQNNLNNSAALNLRGLGPDATLTLINGHRLSYDSIDQGIDIAAIPLGAIERVEVVADGASALYGSDAVAGVANLILRRDYEGLEATARAGAATDGGDVQQQVSLVGGHRWGSGGFMFTLDENSATPITAGERDYTRGLDPSLFLTNRTRQLSAVVSAHQQLLPGLQFELDANAMDRRSLTQAPFSPTLDVHVSGLVDRTRVTSYGLSPTLRADLGPWQASLSGSLSNSRTFLDAYNYYSGVPDHSHILYEDNLKGAEVTAEGPLVALPGGDARLALGGGFRGLWLHDRQLSMNSGAPVTVKNFRETRNVQFAYGELSLPLVGPGLGLPLVERLMLTAAVRYEHWNAIAAVTTPKFGLIYEPSRDLALRATWGKSFKIPTLLQVTQPQTGGLYPGIYFAPPPQRPGSAVLFIVGSAPNLKPERATTWSTSVELKPHLIPGLDLQATYFHVDYRDRIAKPLTSLLTSLYNPLYASLITYDPSAAQVNSVIASLTGGFYNLTGAPVDPSNVGAIVDESARNTARQKIHGVDLNADYHLDLAKGGRLLLTGAASYLQSRQQLVPGQPLLPLAGTIFHPPRWRGRAGIAWDRQHAGLAAFVNYLGPTIDNTDTNLKAVPALVTLDLTASIRTGAGAGPLGGVEVSFSALNLLNEKPHHVRNQFPEAVPYDSTNESPVGRFLGISIRKAW